MISFSEVGKRYEGGNEALAGISFEVQRGEMVFLTGPSGAGKSTLLKLVALMERPSRGQLVVNGQNLAGVRRGQLPYYRRQIGMVFQDHRLLNDRTVFDNVALPLVIAGTDTQEIAKRVRASLDLVNLLHKEKALPVTLSTGEQQRVGIARAVVYRPPILIADEPTGNLDPELSLEVMQLFKRLNQVGTTLLIASHDRGLVQQFAPRVLHLKGGRLAESEEPHGHS
ncbi:MAG TPA: cell division ATP-binding protein FtsE [Gammaproteobacteria bacterium]|jgi:cell division transport system ATP-binding protein|nr:cell division ATP-binding protein FtsE [Gammaproteobacteria bacterium]